VIIALKDKVKDPDKLESDSFNIPLEAETMFDA